MSPAIHTDRLILREWRDDDLAPFAALNADERVVEFLPGPLNREQSDATAARIRNHFDQRGFGLWAVEVTGVAPFIGFVGLSVPSVRCAFHPLRRDRLAARLRPLGPRLRHRGRPRRAPRSGSTNSASTRSSRFTVPDNLRSRAVMERIGMRRSPVDDFEHPNLPPGHPLRRHVLYRRTSSYPVN